MSDKLRTNLLGVTMENPVIAASGTFGFGKDYAELIDVSRLGGISGKGLTLNGSCGNAGIRAVHSGPYQHRDPRSVRKTLRRNVGNGTTRTRHEFGQRNALRDRGSIGRLDPRVVEKG